MSTLLLDSTLELVNTREEFAGEGDCLVEVSHSSLNFKDAKVMRGDKDVVRTRPLVPGIDVVGTHEGQLVTINGHGLGEFRHGGYTEQVRVNADQIIPVPERFSAQQAAAIGTAGYTAALSVVEIAEHYADPASAGPVLVTGATGGVGSVATHLLSQLGFEVHALTGRAAEHGEWLRGLGAAEIVDRAEFAEAGKPLAKGTYAAVLDAVGSTVLANALARVRYGGIATACGLAGGADLPATVLPFILRGVRLVGIDSVQAPREQRLKAWSLLSDTIDLQVLDGLTEVVPLAQAPKVGAELLAGQRRGRTVIDVRA
ncbi:acryloyl-CoA reductase [Corynebacterium tapiri]|uniref:Acryloyl-CoA reductase n=1 Tax=Corynebacterium tapiri TaxID=1448266 RepID=A0A5C4U1R2_9CORY|nr:acryloyl-CoA reductase [Corynebacterium tapiri]TNL95362.1 acryloyl-CoA reductase [Corynebacterium tapiri]